jgi:magnesium-transporting ATPase (P-type)
VYLDSHLPLSHHPYISPFPHQVSGQESGDDLEAGLTLDAVFGIKDPLRPDVTEAVAACQEVGFDDICTVAGLLNYC